MADVPTCPHQAVCATVPGGAHFREVATHSGLAALRLLTLNHRAAGLGALADAGFTCERAAILHDTLRRRGVESMVLATCNRTELYWRARVPGDDEAAATAFGQAIAPAALARVVKGAPVAEHLFRVCCGLESLVLGEAEILGQVRAALDACPGAGPFISGVVRAALRTGRLARAETGIGVGAMSVASAAVKRLAGHVPLARSRVLVIGTGATGLKVARHLRALGVQELVLANRTVEHAAARAEAVGAVAVGLEGLRDEIRRADAIVAAAAAPTHLVTAEDLAAAVAARPGRAVVTVDLSMPPVIAQADVPGVVRLDLRTLEQHVGEQRERRTREVPRVEGLIAHELAFLHSWARQQALRPLVADLRRKVEQIRQAELARAREELAGEQRVDAAVLDRLSRRLLDHVLALPMSSLESAAAPLDPSKAALVRHLFALDQRESA